MALKSYKAERKGLLSLLPGKAHLSRHCFAGTRQRYTHDQVELTYHHTGGQPASADSTMQPMLERCDAQRLPLAWRCSVPQPCSFTTRVQVRTIARFEYFAQYKWMCQQRTERYVSADARVAGAAEACSNAPKSISH